MNIKYESGSLLDVASMTIELNRGSSAYVVDVVENNGELSATVTNQHTGTTTPVQTKKSETLEDILTEISIHLTDA
jgi:hypothetical protein